MRGACGSRRHGLTRHYRPMVACRSRKSEEWHCFHGPPHKMGLQCREELEGDGWHGAFRPGSDHKKNFGQEAATRGGPASGDSLPRSWLADPVPVYRRWQQPPVGNIRLLREGQGSGPGCLSGTRIIGGPLFLGCYPKVIRYCGSRPSDPKANIDGNSRQYM